MAKSHQFSRPFDVFRIVGVYAEKAFAPAFVPFSP
jgi:hypothetical protein